MERAQTSGTRGMDKQKALVHAMEHCYSAIKRKGARIHATTRLDLANVTPSEQSRTRKAAILCGPSCVACPVRHRQIHRGRKQISGFRGGGEEGLFVEGRRCPFGGNEKVLEPGSGGGSHHCECSICH